jgi:ABC-type multidrug transport system fused ATPase/permease subunit
MLAHPVSEFLGTGLIAILLWYGGGLILADHASIDAAEFIYYLVIFYSIIGPSKDLTKALYSVRKGMASLERIDRILNTESTIKEPLSPKALSQSSDASAPFITYSNVSFAYQPEVPVLTDINLSIRRGQTIAFVGQSGSGKTTLVDLLPRFYDVTGGAIRVDGIDIRDLRIHDLRGLMGIVNQDAILFNDTIWNNITFGVEQATEAEVREAARIANALDFITATPDGFDTVVGDRGSRLSGGQRQRISIARAILKNPEILILDEATSALDTESEQLVQQALDRLMQDRTTLVVAHRLSTIRNADLICVLHEGRIVEAGTHEELLKQGGHYAKLISMQTEKTEN